MNWPRFGLMENKMVKGRRHETGKTVTTPSWFGSHSSMVVDQTQENMTLSDDEVLCKDDKGYYVTKKNRLDSGLADPNRYSDRR